MITSNDTRTRKSAFSFITPKRNLLLVILCSFGLILASCGDNSTGTNGDTGGNGNGDTGNGGTQIGTDPTFTNVQQIFETNCGGGGCHISTRTNGVRLDTYDNVINSSGDQYGELVVQPGDPAGSPLVDKIEPGPDFGVRMPNGRAALTDERINQIKTWIDEGAQDN